MPEGFDLGSAYAKVILDTSGIDSGIATAKTKLGGLAGLGANLQQTGQQVSNLGGVITTLTAPMTAAAGVGLNTAANFEQVLKQIQLFGKLSPAQLERVRGAALKWGADTQFSALDSAQAMLNLLKAGQSVEDSMVSMEGVLALAGSGNISLAESSNIVTGALAQFGLQASDSILVADLLAQAANASKADVSDLGMALSNVGPVADLFDISLQDTVATLAVFADRNVLGAEAGTQLRSMLLNLNRPTDSVKESLSKMGIELYNADGSARDFNSILLDMQSSLATLPDEQANEFLQTVAGSYGIVGLTSLLAAGGIDSMRQKMQESPKAIEVASIMMEGFSGKVESLRGSLETLQIEAVTPFMNTIGGPFVEKLIGAVNATADWASKNEGATTAIITVAGAGTILGGGLIILGQLISATGTVITFFTTTALGGMLLKLSAITAAIMLAIEAVQRLQRFLNEVGNAAQDAANKIAPLTQSGQVTQQNVRDQMFASTAAQFGGGFIGDLAARAGWETTWRPMADATYAASLTAGRSRDSGGQGMPGMAYAIGTGAQPELFVPNTAGNFYPADQWMNGGSGGMTISNVNVYANSYAEGRAAGKGFADELEEYYRGRGNQ